LTVDFAIKRFYGCTVAAIKYVGGWKGDDMLRGEFKVIQTWAKDKGIKTGRWFFAELDGPEVPDSKRRWEASIEVKGKARSKGNIKLRSLPPTTVAFVKFDPDKVSARLVYHGLESWLSWKKKEHRYKEAGTWREVYNGDPWTNTRAWANTEVQVPVKKLG
jgi:effector-binding domain-containing protein